jgi:hypothetical protein
MHPLIAATIANEVIADRHARAAAHRATHRRRPSVLKAIFRHGRGAASPVASRGRPIPAGR